MIKFKKKMKYIKGFILFALFSIFAFSPLCFVSSYAWSTDSNGNLVSDNLIDASNREGRYWVTTQSDISATINDLHLGTYSISCDLTPISIDNGYNIQDCFFLLQVVGGQYSGEGLITGNITFTSLNETKRGYLTFTKESYTNYEFRLWGFGNHSGGNHGIGRISNIMLNTGSSALSYEPYGAVYYSQDNYDSVGYNILGGLESFDAINLYYSNSMTFVSTNGGSTYVNANNQDVSNTLITNSDGSKSLLINKDNPWGYNNYYYVHVDFSYPVFLWRLRIRNSLKPTDFIKVVVNDREITYFDYKPNIDGSSYIVSGDIYQQTNSVDFYFRINGYTSTGDRSFVLGYDGYNVGVDSYRKGYEKGQEDLQPKIEALEDKVIMLSNDNDNLRVQLGNNFGWQSLFFAMADTPFYTVSNMLNFEVLGINLFQALIGFITIIAIVWILKRLVK